MKIAQLIVFIFMIFKLSISIYKELNSEDMPLQGVFASLLVYGTMFIVLYYAKTFSEIL